MRIAYLINKHLEVSHSFIPGEILALERLGFYGRRIELRGWNAGLVDTDDQIDHWHTCYVGRAGSFATANFVNKRVETLARNKTRGLQGRLRTPGITPYEHALGEGE